MILWTASFHSFIYKNSVPVVHDAQQCHAVLCDKEKNKQLHGGKKKYSFCNLIKLLQLYKLQ